MAPPRTGDPGREEFAEAILERMSDAYTAVDRDYRILAMNAAAERLLRTPREALIGHCHWDAFPASRLAPFGDVLRRTVAEGVEQHLVHRYRGEGHDLFVEVDLYPTVDGGAAMFWRDVTARALDAQVLRDSEEKYRTLFNEMDEAYALVEVMADERGRWNDFLFLDANPAFVRHTGMPYPVGRTAIELLGTPNPRWAQLYGRVVETGEAIRVEESEVTLGRVFDLNIFRVGGAGSRKVAVLFSDITERKRADAALRDSERRYRALFDAIDEGFLVVEVVEDAQGQVVDAVCVEANPAASRLTGLDDFTGRRVSELMDEAQSYWVAICSRVARSGVGERVERFSTMLGRWFDCYVSPANDAAGRIGDAGPTRVAIVFQEVTARHQAEEALRTADRHKDEFLATLAHELRNPLAPISNALQFLRYDHGRRRADRLLAMVERQVRQMVRLIDDLMDVTRISRGKVDLRRAPVLLSEVLDSAMEASQQGFQHKRQVVEIAIAPAPLALDADKARLIQVFSNLLNNAAKYTPPEGRIRLSAVREGEEAVVRVSDSGMGIPAAHLPRIFEMFSQPHGRNGHTDSGLGIGLAMVRSLVGLHGGSVEAHSGGPGLGSEFVVRLPLRDGPARDERQAPRPGASLAPRLNGRRILVVDDNRDAADSLCQLLEAQGAQATPVYDGAEALATLARFQPHAIVLDLGMPVMDGCEVARRIRRDPALAAIRLVALSGWGQAADREGTRRAGFDHHLTKPANMGELASLLSARDGAG